MHRIQICTILMSSLRLQLIFIRNQTDVSSKVVVNCRKLNDCRRVDEQMKQDAPNNLVTTYSVLFSQFLNDNFITLRVMNLSL